jgi:hypothetical protein
MFKIIGDDGQTYGPATLDQIRQWIRERRVNRHTRVFVHDPADWTPAGLVPELAPEFPGEAPPIITPPATAEPSCSLAKAGLVCGLLSVTVGCCCGGLPFNLLGLIFSIIALVQTSENPRRYGGGAMALVGLILSIIGCLLLALFLVIH